MPKLIRLSKSSISILEKEAVLAALDKEYLGMGEITHQFENLLAEYFGRDVVCVSTGTGALHLALQAAGIKRGDEVLVQSLTYVASFQAISATGAIPIACDIEPRFCSIDLNDAERKLTPRTKAIMPVHYAGQPGELDKIYDFARSHRLRVIEDAAHAFGSSFQGKKIGSFGDIVCFSFDGIKNITSGEGGCIVSGDAALLEKTKDLRLLGVKKDTEMRYAGKRSWEFSVTEQGWRYHMSNLMAAIGIQQLKRFPEMAQKRKKLAQYYRAALANNPHVSFFEHNYDQIVPHIFPVLLPTVKNKEKLRHNLETCGIQTGVHYQPNHWLEYYYQPGIKSLPNTEHIYSQLLSLPLHVDLQETDIDYISEKLLSFLDKQKEDL